jgi:hypothetical protein
LDVPTIRNIAVGVPVSGGLVLVDRALELSKTGLEPVSSKQACRPSVYEGEGEDHPVIAVF